MIFALAGNQNCGKTTLFKVLTGEYSADDGDIYKAKDCVTGYMEQHVCRDLHRSAYHEVLTVFSSLLAEHGMSFSAGIMPGFLFHRVPGGRCLLRLNAEIYAVLCRRFSGTAG